MTTHNKKYYSKQFGPARWITKIHFVSLAAFLVGVPACAYMNDTNTTALFRFADVEQGPDWAMGSMRGIAKLAERRYVEKVWVTAVREKRAVIVCENLAEESSDYFALIAEETRDQGTTITANFRIGPNGGWLRSLGWYEYKDKRPLGVVRAWIKMVGGGGGLTVLDVGRDNAIADATPWLICMYDGRELKRVAIKDYNPPDVSNPIEPGDIAVSAIPLDWRPVTAMMNDLVSCWASH